MQGEAGKDGLKGSFTVEMSMLMPFVLLLIMGCILAVFYYHDKNILSGAAYETAVVGSTLSREKNDIDESKVEKLYRERIRRKCILFENVQVKAMVEDKQVTVSVKANHRKMKIHIIRKAAITRPEKYIRKVRKIKEMVQH